MVYVFRKLIMGVLASARIQNVDAFYGIFNNKNEGNGDRGSSFYGNDKIEINDWEDNVQIENKAVINFHWDQNKPSQIAVFNQTTNTGMVMNGAVKTTNILIRNKTRYNDKSKRVTYITNYIANDHIQMGGAGGHGVIAGAELNGANVIVDMENPNHPIGIRTDKSKNTDEIKETLLDWDMDSKIEEPDMDFDQPYPLRKGEVKLEPDPNKREDKKLEHENTLIRIIYNICPYLVDLLLKIKGKVRRAIKIVFAPILWVMNLIFKLLEGVFPKIWFKFENGFMAFLNVFKWLYRFFIEIPGGILKLSNANVKFGLNLILTARNGAKALFEILKRMAQKINIMALFKGIFRQPKLFCGLVNGLGGMISAGVNGVFGIFAKMYDIIDSAILGTLKKFVNNLLDCIRGERPKQEEINDAADSLLEISRQQKAKYNNGRDFEVFDGILEGMKGRGRFAIKGLSISSMVNVLKDGLQSPKKTVLFLLNFLNPFAPMKIIIAQLFVDTVKSLNETDGIFYLKQLFPEIEIPKDALSGVNRNLAGNIIQSENVDADVVDLPIPDMLRSLPVIKNIYKEFDKVAQEYTNSSLEFLLETNYVAELVEFTTKVIGLR